MFTFQIRHRIDDLVEEIYEFEVTNSGVSYKSFWLSKRTTVDGVFGFDYDKFNRPEIEKQIDELREKYYQKFGLEKDHWCECGWCNTNGCCEFSEELTVIEEDYDQKKNAESYLSGTSYYKVNELHPLKVGKDVIMSALQEKIRTLDVKV